jgi:hypothetical protein
VTSSIALRQYIRLIIEATARIPDLTKDDILNVLSDILGSEPLVTYTEKLAGQFLEVIVGNGEVMARFKDANDKGLPPSPNFDIAGVAKAIRASSLADSLNVSFQFEVLKPENRPDYLDYAIGDQTIAVEFTGRMTAQIAKQLNDEQQGVRFLSQSDITKRPRPLSPELRSKVEEAYNTVAASPRLTKDEKLRVEDLISQSLVEIFGESIFGGPPEGIFVTGASKPFKIPERSYADIQRIHVPIYAVFASKSSYTPDAVKQRIAAIAGNEALASSDRIILDLRRYLETASRGFTQRGFRTFFSPDEAAGLLATLESIISGNVQLVDKFYSSIRRRVNDKKSWISTGV